MELKLASPCRESWDRMRGSERVRFCERCSLNVYELSGMGPEEAERLVRESEGRLCIRFYQRKDGTVLTRDCPEGGRRKLTFAFTGAGIAALLLALLASVAVGGRGGDCSTLPRWLHAAMEWMGHRHPLMGKPCPRSLPAPQPGAPSKS